MDRPAVVVGRGRRADHPERRGDGPDPGRDRPPPRGAADGDHAPRRAGPRLGRGVRAARPDAGEPARDPPPRPRPGASGARALLHGRRAPPPRTAVCNESAARETVLVCPRRPHQSPGRRAIAFAAPLVLGLVRACGCRRSCSRSSPASSSGRPCSGGWSVDQPVAILALLGLAFLLFLAGPRDRLRRGCAGRVLRLTALGFALSFAIALAVGLGAASAAGLVDAPLLVAITLAATSLGVLIPVLKDAGESGSHASASS